MLAQDTTVPTHPVVSYCAVYAFKNIYMLRLSHLIKCASNTQDILQFIVSEFKSKAIHSDKRICVT